MKNLEPIPTENSFRGIKVQEVNYGPDGTDENATDIHGLENSYSTNFNNTKPEKMKVTPLQRSIQKLDATIGDAKDNPSIQQRRSRKVSFDGVTSSTQERKSGVAKLLPADVYEYELEGFHSKRRGHVQDREQRKFPNSADQIPLPPVNGTFGPPLMQQSNYKPLRRAAEAFGLSGQRNGNDEQRDNQQHSQAQIPAAINKIHSAYINQINRIAGREGSSRSQGNSASVGRHELPQYSGNLAARAMVENSIFSPQQQKPEHNRNLFARSRSAPPVNGDNIPPSFFSTSLRGRFSARDLG